MQLRLKPSRLFFVTTAVHRTRFPPTYCFKKPRKNTFDNYQRKSEANFPNTHKKLGQLLTNCIGFPSIVIDYQANPNTAIG